MSFTFVTGFVTNIQANPLLLGLRALLYQPNQSETVAMGDCYILCGRSRVPGPLWLRFVSDASGSLFATRGVTGRSYRRPLSPSSSGCRCHGSLASRPQNGLSCPLSSVFSCYRSVLFFVKNFAVILVEARESSLALFLAWLLGDCRSSVARKLPPVLCGSGTGPGLLRARSLGHSLLIHPSPDISLGLSLLMVSACLHTYVF